MLKIKAGKSGRVQGLSLFGAFHCTEAHQMYALSKSEELSESPLLRRPDRSCCLGTEKEDGISSLPRLVGGIFSGTIQRRSRPPPPWECR